MNTQMTSVRSSLLIPTLSSLLFICVNGPPLKHFDSRKYVISWLKSGRHSAIDKPTGKSVKDSTPAFHCKLFYRNASENSDIDN